MSKLVVINGLARSGTNLLANLLAAQRNWHVSDSAIAELNCIDHFLPKDFLTHYPKSINSVNLNDIINKSLDSFKTRCINNLISTTCPSFHSIKTNYHSEFLLYYGVPIEVLGNYILEVSKVERFADLDYVYNLIANMIHCEIMGHRTTALTSYASSFLSRSNEHFWIEIVRDPYDRAVSSRQGHSQNITESFLQSKWQLDTINEVSGKNFIVIKYETLCLDSAATFEKICSFLEFNFIEFNPCPVTPDGKLFSGNSSRNVDIFNQTATTLPIYLDSIGSGDKLTKYEYQRGKAILEGRCIMIFYILIVVLSDFIYISGKGLQNLAIFTASLNYLSLGPKFCFRKVYSRSKSRFS